MSVHISAQIFRSVHTSSDEFVWVCLCVFGCLGVGVCVFCVFGCVCVPVSVCLGVCCVCLHMFR